MWFILRFNKSCSFQGPNVLLQSLPRNLSKFRSCNLPGRAMESHPIQEMRMQVIAAPINTNRHCCHREHHTPAQDLTPGWRKWHGTLKLLLGAAFNCSNKVSLLTSLCKQSPRIKLYGSLEPFPSATDELKGAKAFQAVMPTI